MHALLGFLLDWFQFYGISFGGADLTRGFPSLSLSSNWMFNMVGFDEILKLVWSSYVSGIFKIFYLRRKLNHLFLFDMVGVTVQGLGACRVGKKFLC